MEDEQRESSPGCAHRRLYSVKMTNILGIPAYYHDNAAAQEERFFLTKTRFTVSQRGNCLLFEGGEVELAGVDYTVKSLIKLGRLCKTHLAYAPRDSVL